MPLMTERDNVIRTTRYDNEDGSVYLQICSVERDDVPERAGVVRIFAKIDAFIRRHPSLPNTSIYTCFSLYDMKGYMPAMLLNMVIASEAKKEIEVMYNLLPKH